MHNFRNLEIWRKAMRLNVEIYAITKDFPVKEQFGLTSQIQRSAVSIAANIAEGSAKSSNKDFIRFLEISLGSLFELETEILIANQVGYVNQLQIGNLCAMMDELGKMIFSFKTLLEKS